MNLYKMYQSFHKRNWEKKNLFNNKNNNQRMLYKKNAECVYILNNLFMYIFKYNKITYTILFIYIFIFILYLC